MIVINFKCAEGQACFSGRKAMHIELLKGGPRYHKKKQHRHVFGANCCNINCICKWDFKEMHSTKGKKN